MIKKNCNFKFVIRNYRSGMTIMELVVVLAIFAVISMVVLFSYPAYQERVDIINLANDIAEQIVQAQNSALNGALPPLGYVPNNPGYPGTPWKPDYGVYFVTASTPDSVGGYNGNFIYFISLKDNHFINSAAEVISTYTITKNDIISSINAYYLSSPTNPVSKPKVSITFIRPNSGATFYSQGAALTGLDRVQINIASPNSGPTASITIYPSGRVQVN